MRNPSFKRFCFGLAGTKNQGIKTRLVDNSLIGVAGNTISLTDGILFVIVQARNRHAYVIDF